MVSGNVTDEFGGIMGCSVAEIDASNRVVGGTTTNMEGNYALAIQNVKTVCCFSYVGFKTEVREIGSNLQNQCEVARQYDCVENNSGDGEETFQRRNVFHSATRGFHGDEHVQLKEVEGISVTSVDDALQGRIPDLILWVAERPGQGGQMRIRGTTTILGNSEPFDCGERYTL